MGLGFMSVGGRIRLPEASYLGLLKSVPANGVNEHQDSESDDEV